MFYLNILNKLIVLMIMSLVSSEFSSKQREEVEEKLFSADKFSELELSSFMVGEHRKSVFD